MQQWQQQIHATYPRLNLARTLVDEIVARAARTPAVAPRYSIGSELLRERHSTGTTELERTDGTSPWGE